MHVKRANVYISRCSAETVKINLMVFRFMLYCVVEPETGSFSNDEGDGNENSKNVTMFNFAK